MKNIFKISAFLFVLLLGSTSEIMAQGQKFAYLNSQELILLLPEAEESSSVSERC